MTLFLTESDVQALLPMERAIERVESSFLAQHAGQAVNSSRRRILLPRSSFHFMAAAIVEQGWLGLKAYTVTRQGCRFIVLLFDASRAELLAMIEADHLGRIRTGAASGVATKHMARPAAREVGVFGSGGQARTQLEAVIAVRKIERVRVFSRNPERRAAFCRDMEARFEIPVQACDSAEEVARFAEILITATNSREPVFKGEWITLGAHLNLIGANSAERREADAVLLARATRIAVDSLDQAKTEAGDLIQGLAEAGRVWDDVVELHAIVAAELSGRKSENEITLFKSCGIAIWDVAVAGYIYEQALAQGRGHRLPESGSQ